MAQALAHRGPDDEGTYEDARRGIGLAFRRLSILDLTEGGHQPMADADLREKLDERSSLPLDDDTVPSDRRLFQRIADGADLLKSVASSIPLHAVSQEAYGL